MKKYELTAQHDSHKSFYGKATVIDRENGTIDLYSYDTLVSKCINGNVIHLGKWSQTTTRHQKEFERQYNYQEVER